MNRDPDDLFMFVPDEPNLQCGPIILPDPPLGNATPNWLGEYILKILRTEDEIL